MYNRLSATVTGMLLLSLALAFPSCIKDKCSETHAYTYYIPVYKAKSEVLANIKSNAPKEIEEPGKIYIKDNYIFLNDIDKGIHVIDYTNPSSPQNIAFIDIPGNMDIAVKENILYADQYADLVAIDISNPTNVKLVKTIEGTFPERKWGNGFSIYRGDDVVVSWNKKDTVVVGDCERSSMLFESRSDVFFLSSVAGSNKSASPIGTGGSMARFTIVNDYLYTVDRHSLNCFSISDAANPDKKNQIWAGWDIETIYPFKNTLFMGSMGGMFIYDITNPTAPVKKSEFIHARACDPVVADDQYAFVTLRAGTNCGPAQNELLVIDVKNLEAPSLLKKYSMTGPAGLSRDNDLLFICDGKSGLKTYRATDVHNLQLLHTVSNIEPYDVIAMNETALVVAADGLYQFDYSNPSALNLLSKITVSKKP